MSTTEPSDYLATAEVRYEGEQYKDGSAYAQDELLLGIGQQLRRIADALESEPVDYAFMAREEAARTAQRDRDAERSDEATQTQVAAYAGHLKRVEDIYREVLSNWAHATALPEGEAQR